MLCVEVQRDLGELIDGELADERRARVEEHLAGCAVCREALDDLRALTDRLAEPHHVEVPPSLWPSIQTRLRGADSTGASKPIRTHKIRRWATAAAILLAVGAGLFGLSTMDAPARASSIDFGVLLDALPLDAHKAFRKFLVRYDAKPSTPVAAERVAPALSFATPAELPGGFRLQSVYTLRFGDRPGVAATYDRNGEFLGVVFHRPGHRERFGTYNDLPCVIGKHCGHKVEVGRWKLVHLTDPTTCHCVLSRLDEGTELPAILHAIAPLHNTIGAAEHD